jgi:hypothetical protein
MTKLIERIELVLQSNGPVELLEEKGGWRKALAMGLAGASMLSAPMKAHGQEWWQATPAQAEQAVTQAWSQLSPKQQQNLRQEERDWIKWKDKLPADRRTWATADRAHYLQAYKKGGKSAADDTLYHTFSGDFISPGADGELTFNPAAATQEDIRSYDTTTPNAKDVWKSRTELAKGTKAYAKGFAVGKEWLKDNEAPGRNERQAFWSETFETYLPLREVTPSETQEAKNYATGFVDAVFGVAVQKDAGQQPTPEPTPEPEARSPEELAQMKEWQGAIDKVTAILNSDQPLPPGITHMLPLDSRQPLKMRDQMQKLRRQISDRLAREQHLSANQFPEDPEQMAQRIARQDAEQQPCDDLEQPGFTKEGPPPKTIFANMIPRLIPKDVISFQRGKPTNDIYPIKIIWKDYAGRTMTSVRQFYVDDFNEWQMIPTQ